MSIIFLTMIHNIFSIFSQYFIFSHANTLLENDKLSDGMLQKLKILPYELHFYTAIFPSKQ